MADTDETTTPTPPATPPAPASATPPTPPPDGDAGKVYTDAEVEALVEARLKRDRKERPTDEEIAELRAAQAKLDEIAEAERTELDKAIGERDTERAAREAAEAKAQRVAQRSALVAAAAKAGVTDPDAAATLVIADAKLADTLELDADLTVSGAAEAIEALIADKPYLGGTAKPTPPTPQTGAAGPQGDDDDTGKLSVDDRIARRRQSKGSPLAAR